MPEQHNSSIIVHLNILQTSSVEAGKFMNVAISPFSVWTVLVLIREGSGGKTNSQLQNALHLHESNKAIHAAFRRINHVVHVSTMTDLFCSLDI
jgi:serine protease inhibitor